MGNEPLPVRLLVDVTVPMVLDGDKKATLTVPSGTWVEVTGKRGDRLRVAYKSMTFVVAVDDTSFEDEIEKIKQKKKEEEDSESERIEKEKERERYRKSIVISNCVSAKSVSEEAFSSEMTSFKHDQLREFMKGKRIYYETKILDVKKIEEDSRFCVILPNFSVEFPVDKKIAEVLRAGISVVVVANVDIFQWYFLYDFPRYSSRLRMVVDGEFRTSLSAIYVYVDMQHGPMAGMLVPISKANVGEYLE
jgi:hypothetical protein